MIPIIMINSKVLFEKGYKMEEFFLILLTIFALYYLYKKTFKNSGCNCGSADCSSKKKN